MVEFRLLWNHNMDRQHAVYKLIMDDINLRLKLEMDGTKVIELNNIQSDMLSDETKQYN